MKYKDYLILPALAMYLLYASCAYIAQTPKGDSQTAAAEPVASVSPEEICWGNDDSGTGEYWYAEGARSNNCFCVKTEDYGVSDVCFTNGTKETESPYKVDDMHMYCSDGSREYDLIFVNELTAYDCNSDTYYQRGDYKSLSSQLTSGKFVNIENTKDYYVFKENGKSVQYFGDKVYKGNWTLETADSLLIDDSSCKEDFHFDLVLNQDGDIQAIRFEGETYQRIATT